nr:hypothetical protein Iba_chr03dCG7290 [Ipomoea batatas]
MGWRRRRMKRLLSMVVIAFWYSKTTSVAFWFNSLSTRKYVTLLGFNFVGQNHPKAPAADCPEHILSHGVPVQDSPLCVDDTRVHHVVHGQPVLSEHVPVPGPAKVAADTDGGADPAGEPVNRVLLRNLVVKLIP